MSSAMSPVLSSALISQLKHCADLGELRAVDVQFARLVSDVEGATEQQILLAALTSQVLANGDVCLPLKRLQMPEGYWSDGLLGLITAYDWQEEALALHPEVLTAGDQISLLVLDNSRVYLYRYWQYEIEVASDLLGRSNTLAIDQPLLSQGLQQLFPDQTGQNSASEIDWQKVAAAVAVQKSFSVISGGPGTGKTTTVIKLLALYIQQCLAKGDKPKISLAAPTGKAAARLAESISQAKAKLNLPDEWEAHIPEEASTLHRLLGVLPNTRRFRHDQHNPLHLDLLVLDEASMIDLPMMRRLLDALSPTTRLILLGDRDQLASVEAGSVLADICSWEGDLSYSPEQSENLTQLCQLPSPLAATEVTQLSIADSLCHLRKSYRFQANSGIGKLAHAVNQGESSQIKSIFNSGFSDLKFASLTSEHYEQVIQTVSRFYAELARDAISGVSPSVLLKTMAKQQLLCALRVGQYGINGINEQVYKRLQRQAQFPADTLWYAGRPIIITRNDPALSLYNGDMGITAPDAEGRLKVWFEQKGEIRAYLPSRLPEHETVYAMTIHKSQGSEFNKVLLLLPPDDNPVMSRELLYTGITRAKDALLVCARLDVLAKCTARRTERSGGLADRLWKK